MPEARISYVRKLWFPYRGWGSGRFRRGVVLPPPRLVQLFRRAECKVLGHAWTQWRVETETWFEHIKYPESGAWRTCRRGCGAIERSPLGAGGVPIPIEEGMQWPS